MSDIVERLRAWVYTDSLYATAREAAAEIERLRQVVDQKNLTDAERSAITEASEFYIGTRTGLALSGLLSRTGLDSRQTRDNAAECHSRGAKCPERDHLTDAEREAVEWYAAYGAGDHAATLRSLLDRLNK